MFNKTLKTPLHSRRLCNYVTAWYFLSFEITNLWLIDNPILKVAVSKTWCGIWGCWKGKNISEFTQYQSVFCLCNIGRSTRTRVINKRRDSFNEKILRLNSGVAAKFIILTVFPYMLNSSRESWEELLFKLMTHSLPLSELKRDFQNSCPQHTKLYSTYF